MFSFLFLCVLCSSRHTKASFNYPKYNKDNVVKYYYNLNKRFVLLYLEGLSFHISMSSVTWYRVHYVIMNDSTLSSGSLFLLLKLALSKIIFRLLSQYLLKASVTAAYNFLSSSVKGNTYKISSAFRQQPTWRYSPGILVIVYPIPMLFYSAQTTSSISAIQLYWWSRTCLAVLAAKLTSVGLGLLSPFSL